MKPVPENRPKQPTKPLEDRMVDVAAALEALAWMPKYPVEPPQFRFFCKALAGFMQTVDRRHWSDSDPAWNEAYALGWVNPMKWTVDQVGTTCAFFPPPIKWREVYCSHFPPLDKKYPTDLYEVVED